jgi:uncharacterized membrane protein SpoIIM required for sporulation
MVLESIFSVDMIIKRKAYAIFLGATFSFISVMLARAFITVIISFYHFPQSFLIIEEGFSIAFTALLLLPLIRKILERQKDLAVKSRKAGPMSLIMDNADTLKIYLYLFIGIMLTFTIISVATPIEVFVKFPEGVSVMSVSLYSSPTSLSFGDFFSIIGNNIRVIIFCYMVSLFLGTGAIFIISWNASVWGSIFGSVAKNVAVTSSQSPLIFLLLISLVVLPHLLLEAIGYIVAGIAGGILSAGMLNGNYHTKGFETLIKKSLFMLWLSLFLIFVGAIVESQLAPYLFFVLFF